MHCTRVYLLSALRSQISYIFNIFSNQPKTRPINSNLFLNRVKIFILGSNKEMQSHASYSTELEWFFFSNFLYLKKTSSLDITISKKKVYHISSNIVIINKHLGTMMHFFTQRMTALMPPSKSLFDINMFIALESINGSNIKLRNDLNTFSFVS